MTARMVRVATPLVGREEAVLTALRTARAAGVLVSSRPRGRLTDGRVVYDLVRLVPASGWWRQYGCRVARWAAAAVGGVLVAAGLVWLVWVAVAWVVAHWAQIVGVLVVTGVVAGAASSIRAGAHCPGCR